MTYLIYYFVLTLEHTLKPLLYILPYFCILHVSREGEDMVNHIRYILYIHAYMTVYGLLLLFREVVSLCTVVGRGSYETLLRN